MSDRAVGNRTVRDRAVSNPSQLRLGRVSILVNRKHMLFSLFFLIATIVVWLYSLGVGDYPLSISEVISVLFGGGTTIERLVVIDWRLARSLVAIVVGLALGLAGAITQRIARNGLASPDILGISRGATAATVTLMVFSGGLSSALLTYVGIPLAAIIGGVLTAIAIWLLSIKNGLDMYRLVLVGIGVNAVLAAYVTYLLTVTDLNTAAAARVWMVGTLNGRGWDQLWPTLAVLVLCALIMLRLSVHLPILELGTDAAQGLGVSLNRINLILLFISVALAAVTVSAVGPVGFVAFVAPQIAAKIVGIGTPPPLLSAILGAFLMVTSDLIARAAFPWEVPVGIVTSAIGGPFLIWLLWRQNQLKQPS
ncbi:MAG: iron chelate uptake ABC transporter family permease subunit [Corynebacterium sp.]|nr:iron chelate uptake ABC transporter family permease subunit [Corynebacterium sp.]